MSRHQYRLAHLASKLWKVLTRYNQGTQEMDQQWINLSNYILPGLGTVAPRGAHFFHIIILYYFHGGSSTLVNRPGVAGAVL